MECQYYSSQSRSSCLRDVVGSFETFLRGVLRLCKPHRIQQSAKDIERRREILGVDGKVPR